MAAFEENAYIWTRERSLTAELPVPPSPWGRRGWEAMGEPCLGTPPPTPWSHGAEPPRQVGHSAPHLERGLLLLTFFYFSKHTAEYLPGRKKYTMRNYHT